MPPDADQEFLDQAAACLRDVLERIDAFDPDELEADAAEGVVKIRFADGRICVLNRQSAAHQIWLAEGATAWHFVHDPASGRWLDTRGRGDLRSILSAIASERLGRPVRI